MEFEGIFGKVELKRWHTPQGLDEMTLFNSRGNSFYMRPNKLEQMSPLFSINHKHIFPLHKEGRTGKRVWIESHHKDGYCILIAVEILRLSRGDMRNECCAVFTAEQCQDIRRFILDGQAKEAG